MKRTLLVTGFGPTSQSWGQGEFRFVSRSVSVGAKRVPIRDSGSASTGAEYPNSSASVGMERFDDFRESRPYSEPHPHFKEGM